MLLTITTTHQPATDLGYLLHKNPARCQSFELTFGTGNVFYPEATEEKCTVALLLEVDTVEMVRGRHGSHTPPVIDQYISDRPYVASSLLSVAISGVFGSALNGQCKARPDLVNTPMPFTVTMPVLPCRGGEQFLRRLFEPLSYRVGATRHKLDERFPEWGESPYFSVQLQKTATLRELLTTLYVLIPVLDDRKHYFVDSAEVDKLLERGKGWLAQHPEKENIARRYLKHKISLARQALSRLTEEVPIEMQTVAAGDIAAEEVTEKKLLLNEARLEAVLSLLKSCGAQTVIDLGCGEGNLLKLLLRERQFQKISGMDVSIRSLEIARERLRLEDLPSVQRQRIELMHGSLMYRDRRFENYDAAALVEVVEHLDRPRLAAFERVVFEFARPKSVVITTPNREYNTVWGSLVAGGFRHQDHRFEWTRNEFQSWATANAEKYAYDVGFSAVGPNVESLGSPTQMAVFTRRGSRISTGLRTWK